MQGSFGRFWHLLLQRSLSWTHLFSRSLIFETVYRLFVIRSTFLQPRTFERNGQDSQRFDPARLIAGVTLRVFLSNGLALMEIFLLAGARSETRAQLRSKKARPEKLELEFSPVDLKLDNIFWENGR